MANPATSNGASPAPTPSKTEAVREAILAGKTNIADAQAYVKEKHGLEVSESLVSKMKTALAKGKKKKKPGPKPKQLTVAPAAQTTTAQPTLTTDEVVSLLSIAEKVGGSAKLQAFLAALDKAR